MYYRIKIHLLRINKCIHYYNNFYALFFLIYIEINNSLKYCITREVLRFSV